MRVCSRFGCLILIALTLTRGVALAENPQAGSASSTDNIPVVPLMPYSGSALLRTDEAASQKTDPSLATLAPAPTTANGLEEVEILPRKTVILSSQSSWEKGFDSLSAAFKQLDEIVMGAGFDVKGRPFAVFTQTDEAGFHFNAMLPVATDDTDEKAEEALQQSAGEYASEEEKKLLSAVKFSHSPSGKAYRFVHTGPYDDIDTAYEAITAYLDNKDILVNDVFIEEYVTDLTKPDDASLEIYIYVQAKEPPKTDAPEDVSEKPGDVAPQKEELPTAPVTPLTPEPMPEKPL